MLAASLRLVDLSWMTVGKNRLAQETSPYLLSHATNPVDWFPWGEEALAKAKAEDKPIFLSIGYAACHWCHVMERESFEDEGVAKLMNEGFVSIKVDREERPDLDSVYMTATVAMSGSGGWPMSVFLTPSGAPFFAGTYFPKSSKYGRPGFTTILERIRDLWTTDRKQLLEQAKELVRALEDEASMTAPRPIEANVVELAVRQLGKMFDSRWGGFGGAPKFPAPFSLELLLRHHARTGDAGARQMVTTTLDKMAEGGIFDHVGGGFARYSTDERWLAPHFEKMLYDNAQLARVYALASQALGEPRFASVARRTLDYVVREMQGAHGGYFSATDADSEGVEGKFFVWSLREIEELLDAADARAFAAAYDVTEEGNWEEHNILWTPRALDEVARELELTREALETSLARSREILYAARLKRVPPLLDDKVLAAWNGLMIGAMAVASRVLGEPRYEASAARAATTILERLRRPDGGLYRTFREDRAHVEAFLEDYAFLADGLIDLYETSGDPRWLKEALALAERAAVDFAGEADQGFYSTSKQAECLVVRMRESQDGATPSANAVLARALVRLSHHADRPDLRDAAESAIRAHGRAIARAPRAFTTSIDVVERLIAPPIEIALVGTDRAGADALGATLRKAYLPHAVIARSADGAASTHPLLAGKTAKDGIATAYVCRDFVCNAPVTTAADLARDLDEALSRWRGGAKAGIAPKAATGRATASATRAFLDAHPTKTASGDAPPLESRFGDAWISRAGILVASHTEADAKAVVVAAVRAGRNVIAFDLGRAPLVGDALAELASSGGPTREALVLIGILHEPEASHAAKIAAGARAAELDAILVPWTAGEGARDDAALAAAAALTPTGLTKKVGFFFERALTTADLERISSASAATVVGAPLNLLEGEIAPIAAAKVHGLAFIALRPLDAIVGGRLVPLVDPASLPAVGPTGASFAAVLTELVAMEEEYRRTLAAHVQVPPGLGIDAHGLLELSNELSALAREAADVDDVQTFASQGLGSALEAQARLLGSVPAALRESAQRLHEKYVGAVERALSSIARRIASDQAAGTRRLAAVLTPDRSAAFPAIALGAVLGADGVTFALATARTTAQTSSPDVTHAADAFARARAKA